MQFRAEQADVLQHVTVDRWIRIAPQIHARISELCGVRCSIIDVLSRADGGALVVVQMPAHLSENATFTKLDEITASRLLRTRLTVEERAIVQDLQISGTSTRGCFSRLNWLDEALAWVRHVLDLPRTVNVDEAIQHTVEPERVLVSIVLSDGRRYWLKGPIGHEGAIIEELGRTSSAYVPQFIHSSTRLNLFLLGDGGNPIGTSAISTHDTTQIGRSFARLQRNRSLTDKALATLVPDLPSTEQILGHLITHLHLGMSARESQQLAYYALELGLKPRELADGLKRILATLSQGSHLTVLTHDDLHGGNILRGPHGYIFTDWEHIRLGYPFECICALQLLTQDAAAKQSLLDAYSAEWRGALQDCTIKTLIDVSLPLGIATRLYREMKHMESDAPWSPFSRKHRSRILLKQLDQCIRKMFTTS